MYRNSSKGQMNVLRIIIAILCVSCFGISGFLGIDFAQFASAASDTWTCDNAQTNLNDGDWTVFTIAIDVDYVTITDVNCEIINLQLGYDEELNIYLVHPDSTNITLSTDNGGSGEDYYQSVFDDEAGSSIAYGYAPFMGSYQPEDYLSNLDGKSTYGTWKLAIFDDNSVGTGYLAANGWELAITYTERPEAPELDSEYYMDGGLVVSTEMKLAWTVPVDGDGNDIHFQIYVDDNSDFASPEISKLSTTPTGFGGDPDDTPPYTEGSGTAWYDVQSGDGLSNGVTYWWKVRGKDSVGYGPWSDVRSFTIDTTAPYTGWYQTTKEQFDTDTLYETTTRGGSDQDVVISDEMMNEGLAVYADGDPYGTPVYRTWNGTAWSSEGYAQSVGSTGLYYCVVKSNPVRHEYALGTLGSDGDVNVQIFNGDTGTWGNLKEVTADITTYQYRGFDLAYESTSGDLVVLTSNGVNDPVYYTWDGSSWSTIETLDLATADVPAWILLESDPASDEIIAGVLDKDLDVNAAVWSGSSWGNTIHLEDVAASTYTEHCFDIAYEQQSGYAMFMWQESGLDYPTYRFWSGSAWGDTDLYAPDTGQATNRWVKLAADPSTDKIMMEAYNEYQSNPTDGYDINVNIWNGSAWGNNSERSNADTPTSSLYSKRIDCAYEQSGGEAMSIWYTADTSNYYPDYSRYTSSWQTNEHAKGVGGYATILQVASNPHQDGFMLLTADKNYDLVAQVWNGSAWDNDYEMETSLPVYQQQCFMFAYRQDVPVYCTLTSPTIDFDNNPDAVTIWDKVTWTETSGGGTSDITVSIQYLDDSTWTDIPGKSSTASPIYLRDLDPETYNEIRLVATLYTGDGSTPQLEDWKVEWTESFDFPYETNFESDSAYWFHGAVSGTDDWERGTPTAGPSADHTRGSNSYGWATDLGGQPSTNSVRFLDSPYIVVPSGISTGTKFYVSFWQYYDIGGNDSATVLCSNSTGGTTWPLTLMTLDNGTDSNHRWKREVIEVNSTLPTGVMLRFQLTTDNSSTGTEWYIDDLKIGYPVEIKDVYSYGSSTTDEYVDLYNYGSYNIKLAGWTLSSSSGTVYTFGNTDNISAGETMKLTCTGDDDFSDSSDAVILKDNKSKGVDFVRYGSSTTSAPSNILWTGSTNPTAPATTAQYIYRIREKINFHVDTGDCDDWRLWKDTDSDGMPDWWELANSLDWNSSNSDDGANGDPDDDGIVNIDEFGNDINPHSKLLQYDTVEIANSVNIPDGGFLQLENTSFSMSAEEERGIGITVNYGSTLICNQTSINATDSAYPYYFNVWGKISVNSTSIKDVWGNATNNSGGVFIKTNKAYFNSSVIGVSAIGFNIVDSTAVFRNVSTYGITDGFFIDNSYVSVINASFVSNEMGVQVTDSELFIAGVTVSTSGDGLNFDGVSGTMADISVTASDGDAVYLEDSTDLSISNARIKSTDGAGLSILNCDPEVSDSIMISDNNASLILDGSDADMTDCQLFGYTWTLYIYSDSTPVFDNVTYELGKTWVSDLTTDTNSNSIPDMKEEYRYLIAGGDLDTDDDTISNINEVDVYNTNPLDYYDPMSNNALDDYSEWGELEKEPATLAESKVSEPQIISTGGTSLYLFYVQEDDDGEYIKYQQSSDGGISWSDAQTLVTSANNPRNIAATYSDGKFSICWEEDNTDESGPDTVIRYLTEETDPEMEQDAGVEGSEQTALSMSYPVYVYDYSTTEYEDGTITDVDVSDNEIKLEYTEDAATVTESSTNTQFVFEDEFETYGQTFTTTKKFYKVGVKAASEYTGTLIVALYENVDRDNLIKYEVFEDVNALSWHDFEFDLQAPGTYYLEWLTDDASTLVAMNANNPGTYTGGSGYHDGVSQAYDFEVRYYTITYDASGTYVSDTEEISEEIIGLTMKLDEAIPDECTLTLKVSNDGGTNWVETLNDKLITFTSEGNDLAYKLEFTSDGVDTPVVKWIELGRSVIDYGINPNVLTDSTNKYVAYQAISVDHEDEKQVSVIREVGYDYSWQVDEFDDASTNEAGIPKLVKNDTTIYLFKYNNEDITSYYSYNSGDTWTSAGALAEDVTEVSSTKDFSATTIFNKMLCAYTDTANGSAEIFTRAGSDSGSGLNWYQNPHQQTVYDVAYPTIGMSSERTMYMAWKQIDSGSVQNIYFNVKDKEGTTDLNTAVKISQNPSAVSAPSIALDSSESLHAVWIEGSGSSAKLMYWNNTPTDEVSAYMAACNYAKYLPDYGINDGTGDKAIKRRVLQSEFVRAGKNVSWGYGEITANKLTYEVMPRINPTTGTGWVQNYYLGNVASAGNSLQSLTLTTGGDRIIPGPVVKPTPKLPNDWNTQYLDRTYKLLKYMLENQEVMAPRQSDMFGCFDKYVWNGIDKELFSTSYIGYINRGQTSDRLSNSQKVSQGYNPGVNPYPNVQRTSTILYPLAWLYTHDVSWVDSNGIIQTNSFYGKKETLDYILNGFSFIDRIKESNLYYIKLYNDDWEDWEDTNNNDQWNGVTLNSAAEWYKDDWFIGRDPSNNHLLLNWAEHQDQWWHDQNEYGVMERFPTSPGEDRKNGLLRLVSASPYSVGDMMAFTIPELIDAWEILTFNTPWNDKNLPFYQNKALWNSNELPSPDGWETKFQLTGNSHDSNDVKVRDIIYRDLKRAGNFISWFINENVLYRTDVTKHPQPWNDEVYGFTSPNKLIAEMATMYKLYTLTKKVSQLSDTNELMSLKYVDTDSGCYERYLSVGNAIKTRVTTAVDADGTHINPLAEYRQAYHDGYYPELGDSPMPNNPTTSYKTYGPDISYNLVSLYYMGKTHKNLKEAINLGYLGNEFTQTIENSVIKSMNWMKWNVFESQGTNYFKDGDWVLPDSKSTFCVRAYGKYGGYISTDIIRSNCYYWANYADNNAIKQLSQRLIATSSTHPTPQYPGVDNFWWGDRAVEGIRYFEEWKQPMLNNNARIPYEDFTTPVQPFYEMGPPDVKYGMAGTNNGDSADLIVFHDGQNYKITMNYIYLDYYGGPVVRGYSSLQNSIINFQNREIGRSLGNMNFNTNSEVTIPNNLYYFHQQPDYWTPSPFSCARITDSGTARIWSGGSLYQDVYMYNNARFVPGKSYKLLFYATGAQNGWAQWQWFIDGAPQFVPSQNKQTIPTGGFYSYIPEKCPEKPRADSTISAQIKFFSQNSPGDHLELDYTWISTA